MSCFNYCAEHIPLEISLTRRITNTKSLDEDVLAAWDKILEMRVSTFTTFRKTVLYVRTI